jgi:putative peptidoglycan lipid II flippase
MNEEPLAEADLTGETAARLGGRAIALAGVIVVAGVVLSRLLGWVRTSVFMAQYGGRSAELDAFFAAFRIPDALFQLVAAGAVGSALVPVAASLIAQGEAARARRVVATVANLMVLALVPLVVLVWLAAPLIVPVIAPSSEESKVALTTGLTRAMLLAPVLLALAAVMAAGLNAAGVFGAPALAPTVYNLAVIVCAIALMPVMGVYALALGVVVGAMGHVLTQSWSVRKLGLYSLVLDVRDPAVRETLLLMAPRALGLGATQIVFLVNTYFAMQLGNGPNTIYTGAFTALQIPVGLIGVPLGIVLLPPLSQAVARGDAAHYERLVERSLRLLLFVVIPLTGLMLAVAAPSIAVLYQRGAFTAADTQAMAPVFALFLLGLVAHVLITFLAPAFYARKDTRTPVAAALAAVAIDVGAAAALFPDYGLQGLAVAIGLGAWAEVGILLFFLRWRVGFRLARVLRTAALCTPGGVLAGLAALGVDRALDRLWGPGALPLLLADLTLASLAAAAVYLVWGRLLRLQEPGMVLDLARTVLRRS